MPAHAPAHAARRGRPARAAGRDRRHDLQPHRRPADAPKSWCKSMPGIERYAQPEFEQFSNVASSELTLDQWLALARRLNETLHDRRRHRRARRHERHRHARRARLFPRSDGAQRQARWSSSDRCATRARSATRARRTCSRGFASRPSPDARGKGVLVVLNDEINAAREVTKTDALRLNTFQTRGYGVLGVVDADRVVFYRSVAQAAHGAAASSTSRRVGRSCRASTCMLVYQGADGDLIKAAADAGAKGIVIAGPARARRAARSRTASTTRLKKGVFVVTTTRTGSGRIAPPRSDAASAAGRRPDLAGRPPPCACRRRSRAGQGAGAADARADPHQRPAEIQRMFSEY